MKRGKDEEKIIGPMFPRLHVNDTEKGGLRAPPRNKMALYEQLSIPSQRLPLLSSNSELALEQVSFGGILAFDMVYLCLLHVFGIQSSVERMYKFN